MDRRLHISIRWDRLGEKIDRVAAPPFWLQKNQERIKDQFPMLAIGCTWGPVEVRGQKSFVAFAKKQLCRDVALSKTTTAHEEEAPVESAFSQMLAELAAAMEEDEKAESLRMRGMHQTCRAGLQSRAPQSSRSSCKQATRATQPNNSLTKPLAMQPIMGVVQLLPIQITTQEVRIVLLIRKTMKKKRPQIQSGLLTATSGCPATYASPATKSTSFWETCTPTRVRIIKICSCHYQKEK